MSDKQNNYKYSKILLNSIILKDKKAVKNWLLFAEIRAIKGLKII